MTTRLAIVVSALMLAACDVKVDDRGGVSVNIVEGRAADEWTRTYTVAKGGRVELATASGDINVVPAAGSAVEVRATREARARSDEAAQAVLKNLLMQEKVSDGSVHIDAGGFPGSPGFRQNVRVEFRVSVPPSLIVSLKTDRGNINIENAEGTFIVASTNGQIGARALAGSLDATGVNGPIQVGIAEVKGDVRLATVNGPVRLYLPADVKARVDASTVNGGVTVDPAFNLKAADETRTHVSGTINGGGAKIELRTTNGPVQILDRATVSGQRR